MDYQQRKQLEKEMKFINHCLRKQKLANYLSIMKVMNSNCQSLFNGYQRAIDEMLFWIDNTDSGNISALPRMAGELRKACEFQLNIQDKVIEAFNEQETKQSGGIDSFGFSELIPTISCEDVGFIDYCEKTGLKIFDEGGESSDDSGTEEAKEQEEDEELEDDEDEDEGGANGDD